MAPQRSREHFIPTGDHGDSTRVRLTTERGGVLFYTVQYEAWIEGKHRPVVRYDNAHGRPHRDLLGWDGETIRKEWLPDVPFKQALDDAIGDITANWQELRNDFLRRRP